MVWGRDDFLKDWKDFPDDLARWMFNDVNPDGFVDRNDFYYNWNLDAANCMWKQTHRPPDPNISKPNLFEKIVKYFLKLFK